MRYVSTKNSQHRADDEAPIEIHDRAPLRLPPNSAAINPMMISTASGVVRQADTLQRDLIVLHLGEVNS